MANSALETMTSIIPVVVVGGVALKMLDRVMPEKGKASKKRKRQKRATKFGDFSNVGF